MNERKTRTIEIDLDAIEQAALNAPRRGPYQFIYGLQDDIEGIRDTEGFMLFDNGLEGSVDTGMLPFFAAVDPDVILVLVALAKEAKKNLDQQDRITFDLTDEKRPEAVCVGELPEPTLSENAETENGVFTAGTVRKLWRLKERYRVQLAERDALLRERFGRLRKLAERACGRSKDSHEYVLLLEAITPTMILDLTALSTSAELNTARPLADTDRNCDTQ